MRYSSVFALGVLCLLGTASPAQAVEETVDGPKMLRELLVKECPCMAKGFTSDKDMAAIFKDHPLDTDAVCSCTVESVMADERLIKIFSLDIAEIEKKMDSQQLKSYMIARLLASVLACLSPQIEKIAAASSPE